MRFAFALLAIIAAGSLSTPAQADPYQWCASYEHGGRNCWFETLSQCRAAISGDNKGTCLPNPFYDGRRNRSGGSR